MPRIHKVEKVRKPHRCATCAQEIAVGEAAYHWSFFRQRPTYSHARHGFPKASQTTQNSTLALAYMAQENLEESLAEAPGDWESARDSAVDQVQEAIDDAQGKLDNLEQAFEYGSPVIDEIQEVQDNLQSWLDELESWDPTDDDPERDDFDTEEEFTDATESWQASITDSLPDCPV